jgi:hypothetical protein
VGVVLGFVVGKGEGLCCSLSELLLSTTDMIRCVVSLLDSFPSIPPI